MTTWTREPSFGNITKLTGRLVTVVSNSGFTPLLNANDTLTIEAPSINFSTYPELSGTNGRINFLKSDGTTTMAVETENNQLNMNNHKIVLLANAVAGADAVPLSQVNSLIASAVGGVSGYAISRGGASATCETTGAININTITGQATIINVNSVPKATFNGTALTMAMPIAMTNNKITGLTTATNNDEAVNKGQMDVAISGAIGGVTTYSIARGGGSVTAETTGQITLSPPVGQATIMTVAGVTKATLNTSNLTMAVPIAMGNNKISGLTTATNNDEGTNLGQVNTAIATAVANSYQITRASGSVSVGTSGEIINTALSGQFVDTFVGTTRYIRTNAINGTGFSTGIKVPSMSFTNQPIYTGGPFLGSFMDITGGVNNTIAGGDNFKTLLMDFATTAVKGKVSGGIPFVIYDYLGTTTKMNYDESNDKLNVYAVNGMAMNNKKITGLATGTANDEGVNVGQMNSAISAYTPYQITRASAYVNCETGGDISYYVPGGLNKHKFYVQGTVSPVLQIEATSDLAVTTSHAQTSFNLWPNVFSRGGQANTSISYSAGTLITDKSTTDKITLQGNTIIQPTTTNGNLLNVKNVAGTNMLIITTAQVLALLPINMNFVNKITGLLTGTANEDAVNVLQMNVAITSAISAIVSHNPWEIVRGTTSLSIGVGGDLTLSMPLNTASFNIPDPSNIGYMMSNWTTQSGVSYATNRCRTRVQHPTTSSPYLQTWFNTALTQPEILSSTDLNIGVSGATDHIHFRHGPAQDLTMVIAPNYIDSYVSQGQRVYTPAGVLKYTLSTNGTQLVVEIPSDSYQVHASTLIKPLANSTSAFSVKDATGGALLDVDTTNGVLNMNTHKITGVLAGATATTDACNVAQMESYVASVGAHNPYELIRSGTTSYVRVNVNDVITNTVTGGSIRNYYNGLPISVIASAGSEVYTNDTAFKWRKGSSTGNEMYKISAVSTSQTRIDIANDNLLQYGKTTIRPYATNGDILTIATVDGNVVGYFTGNDINSTSRFFSPNNNQIKYCADPTYTQDVATKNYVDTMIGGVIENLVRNPTMSVNQRATGSVSNGTPVDGWNTSFVNPYATIVQEEISDLPGFRWCVKSTTTAASPSRLHIYSSNEGTMTRDLQLGSLSTPIPTTLTISAWVKSSITNHKFCFAVLYGNYECPSSTVIGVADTWVRVSATFPAPPSAAGMPTTGTGNSINWEINPSVPASEGGTNQVWKNTGTGRAFGLSDGTTNMMNIAGTNTFRYTGVQVDIGNVMRPFRHIAHDENLLRCQRYYYRITSNSTTYLLGSAGQYNGAYQILIIPFKTHMRVAPLFSVSSATCMSQFYGPSGAISVSVGVFTDFPLSRECAPVVLGIYTGNNGGYVYFNVVGAYIAFDADL